MPRRLRRRSPSSSTRCAAEHGAARFGELLLAVVVLAQRLGVEPEDALRDATARLEAKVRRREELG